jgi:hypothetical protein
MEDMEVFYDAVLPRAHEILAYCDRFDLKNPPEQIRVLLSMLYSLIVVSSAVEAWKRARAANATRPAGISLAAASGRGHRVRCQRDQGPPAGGKRRRG